MAGSRRPSPARARNLLASGRKRSAGLGSIAWRQGDLEAAERYASEALALFRQAGEEQELVGPLSILGVVAGSRGDHEGALPLYEEMEAARTEGRRRLRPRHVAQQSGVLRVDGGRRGSARRRSGRRAWPLPAPPERARSRRWRSAAWARSPWRAVSSTRPATILRLAGDVRGARVSGAAGRPLRVPRCGSRGRGRARAGGTTPRSGGVDTSGGRDRRACGARPSRLRDSRRSGGSR